MGALVLPQNTCIKSRSILVRIAREHVSDHKIIFGDCIAEDGFR